MSPPRRKIRLAAITAILVMLSRCAMAGAAEVQVCFSPPIPGGCDPTATIVKTVNSARTQILVQAYEFTSRPIAKALVDAHQRGIDVHVMLDKSNLKDQYSEAGLLDRAGVPIMIDYALNIAHSKVMIVDRETVITGSFNFTKSAETQNAENLVVIHDPAIAAEYLQNWESRVKQSATLGTSQGRRGDPTRDAKSAAGQVVGNRRSRIYAWPGCASYDTMSPENRVVFASRAAAEAAGFRAAKNCP